MQEVKIDTKEKFHVITPFGPDLPANLTDKLRNMMHEFLENPVKNVVFNAEHVQSMADEVADCLAELQAEFLARDASFVTCCLQPAVKKQLATLDLLDLLNVAPTESEAWDIVQMEEIEREIFGNETED